jgi:glycosyltransferase involved in cell wall biosynthesis
MTSKPRYSLIIPVFNRPDEIDELLKSVTGQNHSSFEVIIIEDGSKVPCKHIVEKYRNKLTLYYYTKENGGPGPARNYGAQLANGEWVIFLDSDVMLPENYLISIDSYLGQYPTIDAFGGPDRTHPSFTPIQKAISYSMTAFLTTGGIRGSKSSIEKFKPRSFNMGMKKSVFRALDGFAPLRFGEDVDFSLRIERAGLKSGLIEDAYVYHKRRTSFRQFYKQVFNSGIARIVLSKLHPGSLKIVHLLPFAFVVYHLTLLLLGIFFPLVWTLLVVYPVLMLILATSSEKSAKVGMLAVIAAYVQLFAYGLGFAKAAFSRFVLRRDVNYAFLGNFYD